MGDERRLKQILLNFVKNAKKFTRSGSITLTAGYNAEEQRLTIYVKDTGVGIAKSDMPKLFSRFGKLKRTAKMNNEGIGLGLTIVKSIVNKNGGKVYAHSDGKNKGSTFGVQLLMPLANDIKESAKSNSDSDIDDDLEAGAPPDSIADNPSNSNPEGSDSESSDGSE